uniref:Uncharacterized protein n=1 Tax=Picea glauca TaxID=3330 RepID=A0A101LV95_PICGL|nr:hypothetical protein ABT39_MTgene2095 [Picea glauca]
MPNGLSFPGCRIKRLQSKSLFFLLGRIQPVAVNSLLAAFSGG